MKTGTLPFIVSGKPSFSSQRGILSRHFKPFRLLAIERFEWITLGQNDETPKIKIKKLASIRP
jgi:hypothetical protein